MSISETISKNVRKIRYDDIPTRPGSSKAGWFRMSVFTKVKIYKAKVYYNIWDSDLATETVDGRGPFYSLFGEDPVQYDIRNVKGSVKIDENTRTSASITLFLKTKDDYKYIHNVFLIKPRRDEIISSFKPLLDFISRAGQVPQLLFDTAIPYYESDIIPPPPPGYWHNPLKISSLTAYDTYRLKFSNSDVEEAENTRWEAERKYPTLVESINKNVYGYFRIEKEQAPAEGIWKKITTSIGNFFSGIFSGLKNSADLLTIRGEVPLCSFETVKYQYEEGYCFLGLLKYLRTINKIPRVYYDDFMKSIQDKDFKDPSLSLCIGVLIALEARVRIFDASLTQLHARYNYVNSLLCPGLRILWDTNVSILFTHGHFYILKKRPTYNKTSKTEEVYANDIVLPKGVNFCYNEHQFFDKDVKVICMDKISEFTHLKKLFYNWLSPSSLFDYTFNDNIIIPSWASGVPVVEQIDLTAAYTRILTNTSYIFPSSDIENCWFTQLHTDINPQFFYLIELNKKDHIFLSKVIILLGDVIKKLKMTGFKILAVYSTGKVHKGIDRKKFIESGIPEIAIRNWSGVLASKDATHTYTYDINDRNEQEFISELNQNKCCYATQNKLKIAHTKIKENIGAIQRAAINSYLYLHLITLLNNIHNSNDLVRVKTDSLGFRNPIQWKVAPKKVKYFTDDICKGVIAFDGCAEDCRDGLLFNNILFKQEDPKLSKRQRSLKICVEGILDCCAQIKECSLEQLLESGDNFLLEGSAGSGKTWTAKHIIAPKFKNPLFIVPTISLAKEFDVPTFNSVFRPKYDSFEVCRRISDKHDCVIVDEASQLTARQFMLLTHLTTRVILVGNRYQTGLTTCYNILQDNGLITLLKKKHTLSYTEHSRCDIRLQNVMKDLEKKIDAGVRVFSYKIPLDIQEYNPTSDFYPKYILGHTHRFLKHSDEFLGREAESDDAIRSTIHSCQGKTIVDKFLIGDFIDKDIKLIYTALTRARRWEDVQVLQAGNGGCFKIS